MIFFMSNPTRKGGLFCLLQLLLVFPAIGLMMLALKLPNVFLDKAFTSMEVVQGYYHWYLALVVAMVIAVAIILIGNIALIVLLARTGDLGSGNVILGLITILLVGLCSVVMVLSEDVIPMIGEAKEDMAAIESGELTSLTTYAHENTQRVRESLPGPYADGQIQPVWALRARDPNAGWMTLYLPEELGPDLIRSDGYVSDKYSLESQDIQYFTVRYTPNFGVVVELEPLAGRPAIG